MQLERLSFPCGLLGRLQGAETSENTDFGLRWEQHHSALKLVWSLLGARHRVMRSLHRIFYLQHIYNTYWYYLLVY